MHLMLQVTAEAMELLQFLCDTTSLKAFQHCKQTKPSCGEQLVHGMPLLETFATPRRSVNISRGIFQGVDEPWRLEAHTRRRWSGRALARRLGESSEQGLRPRLFSTGDFRGAALGLGKGNEQ